MQHPPKPIQNIIFPALPYTNTLDPMWEEEYACAASRGFNCCLYSSEDKKLHYTEDGERLVTTHSSKMSDRPMGHTLYRGWMLTKKEYTSLSGLVHLVIDPEEYISSHECYGWVDQIPDYTFRTEYHASPLASLNFDKGQRYFVKGASKSFGENSFVNSVDDVIKLLTTERIEDGVTLCVREYFELSTQPEQRFFVVSGTAYGSNGATLPESLTGALKELEPRLFYSLDVAYKLDGSPVVVEVGCGQVSDVKEWQVADFYDSVITKIKIPSNAFAELWTQ